jgi:hypothetical protein
MATFTAKVLPYDDYLGRVVVTQLVPALEHLQKTRPDPAFLPSSVLADTIAPELLSYSIDCHGSDLVPRRLGQAFLLAERDHGSLLVQAKDVDDQLAKWQLDDNLVAGSFNDWYTAVGGNACAVRGGGFVRGPDGQLYPIVTTDTSPPPASDGRPMVFQAGHVPHDGTEWKQVGERDGLLLLGNAAPISARAAAWQWGAMYPGFLPDQEAAGRDVYEHAPMGPIGPEPEGTGTPFGFQPKRGRGTAPKSAKEAGGSVFNYVDGALAGGQVAKTMDNARIWNYRVVYHEAGGARRAEIHMYRLWQDKEGVYYRESGMGSLGPDGKLVVGPTSLQKVEE